MYIYIVVPVVAGTALLINMDIALSRHLFGHGYHALLDLDAARIGLHLNPGSQTRRIKKSIRLGPDRNIHIPWYLLHHHDDRQQQRGSPFQPFPH